MEEQVKNVSTPDATVEVVDIQFRNGQKVYYFDPAGFACKQNDHVIIDTARGPEFGICASGNHHIPQREIVVPLRKVLRKATEQDEKIVAENAVKEKKAEAACLEMIQQLALDMQLVSAEYAFDGSKILFFFTADDRVDFRELVKSLAAQFHTRIELRQIGVRDKAKMVGGLGICGRPFCCTCFLDDFQPVSIKMAKTQNLSLNPTKISGACGKLMCCLKYEQAAYEDLLANAPKAESFVDTPDGRGTIVELDLLRQRVKVRMENQPEVVRTFGNDEIAVLRSGKAKKTDPPIPADLAPISGGNSSRRLKKTLADEEDRSVLLNPIRMRYSEETIAEETVKPEAPAEDPAQKENRNRRRNRNRNRNKGNAPKAEVAAKQEKPAAPAPTPASAEGGEKKSGRKPNYRRRRPHKNNAPKAE